jgi:hypothetical protein
MSLSPKISFTIGKPSLSVTTKFPDPEVVETVYLPGAISFPIVNVPVFKLICFVPVGGSKQ